MFTKNNVVRCNQEYALCSASKCAPSLENPDYANCFCDVLDGPNYSYGDKTCNQLKPYSELHDNVNISYLYSTYSNFLTDKTSELLTCPANNINLDCMNKLCTLNPNNPSQAICRCKISNNNGQDWVTINKKGEKSTCNYLSGASKTMNTNLINFIKKSDP